MKTQFRLVLVGVLSLAFVGIVGWLIRTLIDQWSKTRWIGAQSRLHEAQAQAHTEQTRLAQAQAQAIAEQAKRDAAKRSAPVFIVEGAAPQSAAIAMRWISHSSSPCATT